jgi:hypothetical protein
MACLAFLLGREAKRPQGSALRYMCWAAFLRWFAERLRRAQPGEKTGATTEEHNQERLCYRVVALEMKKRQRFCRIVGPKE